MPWHQVIPFILPGLDTNPQQNLRLTRAVCPGQCPGCILRYVTEFDGIPVNQLLKYIGNREVNMKEISEYIKIFLERHSQVIQCCSLMNRNYFSLAPKPFAYMLLLRLSSNSH